MYKEAEKPTMGFKVEEGVYLASVSDPQVKVSSAGNKYVNCRLNLTDADGNKKGCLFQSFFPNSDAKFCEYMISQFIKALGAECDEELSEEEFCDVIDKRELTVVTKEVPDTYKIDKGQANATKLEVDINTWDGFYRAEEFDDIYMMYTGQNISNSDEFMQIPDDAEDLPFI